MTRSGRKRALHFAHHTHTPSCGGRESAIHRMAKEIVARADAITLPAARLGEYILPTAALQLSGTSTLEVTLLDGATRPDVRIAGVCGSGAFAELYVEIRVTHAVNPDKVALARTHGLSIVEIDLSDVGDDTLQDKAKFTDLVLHGGDNRTWINLCEAGYIASQLKTEVFEVRDVHYYKGSHGSSSGESTIVYTMQRVLKHLADGTTSVDAIELDRHLFPILRAEWNASLGSGANLDRNGVPLPYQRGLYFQVPREATSRWETGYWKTALTPLPAIEPEAGTLPLQFEEPLPA